MEAKISHSGLLARSPEGHAARGMQIKGNEDVWVEIQANTFRNWVNEHLPKELRVQDLAQDLCTGVRLCALVEALRGRPLKPNWNRRPTNQHHYLENVTTALSAIEQDGVKLVNIGNVDIVNGNLKLILGLIWSLIVRYQIGRSKFPPRKLMLAWLQAVLPECRVGNLTTDWNSGVLLSALVDYCRPGLFSHWRQLDKNDHINNCTRAMEIAQRDLGIPAVLEPEYLASPWLDELSGMTYLSYFMKPGSPGFHATLRWVNSRLERAVTNFTSDWNDGRVISEVIRSLGGSATAPEKLRTEQQYWESNQTQAIEAGKRLGVHSILTAKDMSDTHVEHLGVMAYAAHFQWLPERPPLHDLLRCDLASTSGRLGEPTRFQVALLDPALAPAAVSVDVRAPDNRVHHIGELPRLRGEFVPTRVGMHELIVRYEGEEILTGHYFRVLPPLPAPLPPGIAPCALGSLVQVVVSATGAPKRADILVTAYAPSGRPLDCPLAAAGDASSATFQPDEVGEWRIEITYQGRQIQGGPFSCAVFDAGGMRVAGGLEGALPLVPHTIELDGRAVGVQGEVVADVVHDKRSVHCRVERLEGLRYRVHFTPMEAGKHRVYVYFNGYDVKGSPFMMRVGTQKRHKKPPPPSSSPVGRAASPSARTASPLGAGSAQARAETHKFAQDYHRRLAADPPPRTASPSYYQRTNSPNYHRADSPDFAASKARISDKISAMRLSNSRSPVPGTHGFARRGGAEEDGGGVDTSPIIKVSAMADATSRRDSWDAIAKTRSMLSPRSLESVANLADSQLDADLRRSKVEASNRAFGAAERHHAEFAKGGARAVRVQPVPDGVLGQPVEFEIDGGGAGSGDLEILVEGGRVTSSVRSLGGQRFRAAFTPHQALPHRVDIKFNGETVPGSPWHVSVMSTANLSVVGEATRLCPANAPAAFEIVAAGGAAAGELAVHVLAPSKRAVPVKVAPTARAGVLAVEFVPVEVGTHLVEVSANGERLPAGPLVAKVYDAGLIQVADVSGGVLGQAVQFRVDASQAGEGQLEISINEGEVPNHVQVVGGGRCLVSFTPDHAKPHLIDIKFNGETIRGCPFVCTIADHSRVTLSLAHLDLIPVGQPAAFHMAVAGGGAAELAVAVRGPLGELPVKVTGDIHSGFTGEFTPQQVGAHHLSVEYNGRPVQGTPFTAKAFDAGRVSVGAVARGAVGRAVTFAVDASEAGEGNLEITISARGLNIPTQVHPQGNARFAVSFVPGEACDHVVNVAFNKRAVAGCPLVVGVGGGGGGPSVTLPGPGPVHKPATLMVSHGGRLEDIEVNVEGPGGQAVPTQVQPLGNQQFRAEFTPRVVGEHRIQVSVAGVPTAGSPYAAKVYDVQAIKVKDATSGVVGKPVTFLVETSQAGPGNLEVTVNGGRVPTSAQAQGPHTYAISFTPRDPTPHSVDLRFNGQDVPGSPFSCPITPAARLIAPDHLDKVPVGRACALLVESATAPLVDILNPSRRPLPTTITPAPAGYEVAFTPLDVGDHSVEVKLPTGAHIDGSPFLIKAYDANRVVVTDIADATLAKPVSFSINASQAGAGNLEIIVAVGGRNVPNFVQSEGNARFKVNFKPTEAAPHTLSVRFNGHPVPGSPFTCNVTPGNAQLKLPVSGAGIELAPINKPAELRIETTLTPQITVTAPNSKILSVKNPTPNLYHFTPEVVGRHSVAILVNEQHILNSPFSCNVYDVNRVVVSGLPGRGGASGEVSRPVTFSVDAAQAGEGTLELVVSTAHTTIKAEVVACARGLYDVTFVPQTPEDHFVNITFNEVPVGGSPFHCSVVEPTVYQHLGTISSVELLAEQRLEIIDTLSNHHVKCGANGEFQLPAVGTYNVLVYSSDELCAKRTYHVFDPSKIEVLSEPEAQAHRPAVLPISVHKAGPGKLSAKVRVGAKEVAHSVRQSQNEMWELVFHPVVAAPHRVSLYYNGVPRGGAVEVAVRGVGGEVGAVGAALSEARVGRAAVLQVETRGRGAREFDVVVSGPGGGAVPVRCYVTKGGRLQAEFTAREAGGHTVEVLCGGKAVEGSPFRCEVFEPEAVRMVDIPHVQGNVNERVAFNVSTKGAGLAELETQVTNPIGHLLAVQHAQLDDHLTQVSFLPTIPGLYQVAVTYGAAPVKGSPLALGVGPVGPTPPPRAVGKGLESGQVGERTSFTVSSALTPRVQIEAGEGSIEAHVQSPKPGEYLVSYTPKWVGTYDVVIGIGANDLPGSPFRPQIVDVKSIRLLGGWPPHLDPHNRLLLPTTLTFDTTSAGPLPLTLHLASRPIAPSLQQPHRARFDLTATDALAAGEHDLLLRLGPHPLPPPAPTAAVLARPAPDQVRLSGRGLAHAQCNEPATFTIDGSHAAAGNPEASLIHPETNLPIPVMLSLAGEQSWRGTYTITSPGSYHLTVLWAGRPVQGCPLHVEAKGGADASRVLCSGEGLRQGVVGREIRSWIDTRRAGPGELTAHCSGPRKVAYCELYDHGDATFTLNVKPQESGRHALTIKYAGQHVAGSPFALRVAGAPDASKVRVYGPGIEHGVLATFQSRFICDTRGAGAGQLTVRVRGPKGAFRVEMQRESQKDRTILCKYDPTEPGDYRVEVKWAGELVPGSPFPVMIFDTQEELRRYISSL